MVPTKIFFGDYEKSMIATTLGISFTYDSYVKNVLVSSLKKD